MRAARRRARAPEPGRAAARDGAARHDGPTLCYLGHVDTVLATRPEWTPRPWSGDIADGFLWGRGALDMKSQVAAEIAAARSLARSGWRPARGELLIVAVVDEETGGALGAAWITENHPEKVRCDLLVNEGGGAVFEYGGKRRYGVCCAEKGVFRFTVSTDGVAGHASMPGMGDNALLKMAPAARALRRAPAVLPPTAEPRAFLQRASARTPTTRAGAVERLRAADPRLATIFEPMLGVTFTPTRITRLGEDQRDPQPRRAESRLPRAARPRRAGGPRGHRGGARRGRRRLADRVHRAGRRQPLADRTRR